jgi:uncharacterized damage-inducible protein DinB
MYNYHVWANGKIMNRLKELPQDVYHKEINRGFSSISKVVSHIYLTDYTWLGIISGTSMSEAMAHSAQLKEDMEAKSIKEIENSFLELSTQYKSFLNENQADKAFKLDNPYAGVIETSVSETILHVMTHGSYHRGNIATMLRQMGYPSVMQDYGLYLYSK